MIVEVDHYPRCVYVIDGGHNLVILGGLWFIYKASPPKLLILMFRSFILAINIAILGENDGNLYAGA
ncbi:hypothetical protein A6M27_09290 [Acidithiobacillus thiooxidans]|uniref:Uncharacterized protein n=1 Tax=Acidithiobacillus thiooxidans TaxID=930 RepID=A0A1C2HVK5_ACITH|nr:hypothetical protein A6M23_20225 [Acidithiobacillus thiooxidans]OCX70242.1 hypothetical protein A6P07_14685 [Acidithiobacillus thiooxidans]OCX76862.1 hypothetical protein A6O24_08055 [Acidithiobacillus thiooxidans]OCX82469.1 hypothetical protein A6P08_12130 [Acidithiobacillus thiooxidans]OCX84288.1 hypothetical protein A6O26_04620 [Acidithiobacillus thiooxidans]